jgi:EamA domain-containing membrane protein RarD
MYSVARFLQFVGLTIPLLAIVAQLNESISQGQMLGFLVVSMAVFGIGHLLQRYSGGNPN